MSPHAAIPGLTFSKLLLIANRARKSEILYIADSCECLQASEFRRLPGCSVISRPVRLRVLRDTLMQKLNLEESSSTAEEDSIRFQQSEAAKTVRYLSFLSICLHAHVDLQNGLLL